MEKEIEAFEGDITKLQVEEASMGRFTGLLAPVC
jgi:hypothetical protein